MPPVFVLKAITARRAKKVAALQPCHFVDHFVFVCKLLWMVNGFKNINFVSHAQGSVVDLTLMFYGIVNTVFILLDALGR